MSEVVTEKTVTTSLTSLLPDLLRTSPVVLICLAMLYLFFHFGSLMFSQGVTIRIHPDSCKQFLQGSPQNSKVTLLEKEKKE